jgi:type IV pilus assembly protein PilM
MYMFAALSRILPPPSYITMPAVGVDISDASLKYVHFKPTSRADANREMVMWGDIPIPSGVVNRGNVEDHQKLVAVLKEFKAKTGAEFIRVSLPEERAYLFETEVKSQLPLKEVRGLLEFRLEENVPIPSKDVLFDYTLLPTAPDARSTHVSVVAYARNTIEAYFNACREADLRPLTFEVEAQSMARAMIPRDLVGSVMIVDFGKTRTGIGIVSRGVLLYTSTIDIGGEQLSQVLRKVLGDTAESELTKIKNTAGLVRGQESGEVRDALLSTVSVIKDELATRMQYWNSRNHQASRRIERVMLCGGSSNLLGLPEYLTESLGVPTTRGNVWENAFSLDEHIPAIDKRHSYGYAAAIGLALRNIV